MKKISLLYIVVFLAVSLAFNSFQVQQDHKVLFEKAKYTMETKADLQGAIDLFEILIKQYPNEKEYVAKSLLYQGICYEKLGNQQAVKKYERLVNNYPGQKQEVAMAKERLKQLLTITEKKIEVAHKPKFTKINIPTELSGNLALSPDGEKLLLVSNEQLWIMPLSGNLGHGLPGKPVLVNTYSVKVLWAGFSWSGDGENILFNELKHPAKPEEKLKKNINTYIVSAEGGIPKKIIENNCAGLAMNYRTSLSPDGRELVFSKVDETKQYIYTKSMDGGEPKKLVDIMAREAVFSPDGKMIAYVEDKRLGGGGGNLWVIPATGGEPTMVAHAKNAGSPVWSPDASKIAYLDYLDDKKIHIVPFDNNGKPAGEKFTISVPKETAGINQLTGWSTDNKIGVKSSSVVSHALYTLPESGGQAAMVVHGGSPSQPRWFPDGKKIVFMKSGKREGGWPNHKLAIVSADGGKDINILSGKEKNIGIIYFQVGIRVSPNGRKIAISATKQDETVTINNHPALQIWTVSHEGEQLTKITEPPSPYTDYGPCWSPDGKSIAFVRSKLIKERKLYGETSIYTINSSGGEPKLLIAEPEVICSINWSHDGQYIAYLNENTLKIVDVKNGISKVVGKVPRWNVNTELAWSADNKRIAFNDHSGKVIKVMSVDDGQVQDVETGLVDANINHLDWSSVEKRFVFTGYQGGNTEFWLLEDFLPLDKLAQKDEKKFTFSKVAEHTNSKFAAGNPSPNGNYFIFTDWDTGNLAVYDCKTNKTWPLTSDASWKKDNMQYTENATWSPNGKQIVYNWFDAEKLLDLRVLDFRNPEPKVLFGDSDVVWAQTYAWSDDGEQILACFQMKDDTRKIVLINAKSGDVKPIKTLSGKGWVGNMAFSPCGQYIVYDYPTKRHNGKQDIYLLTIDGFSECCLSDYPADDKVLTWTPNGKEILIASDRSGNYGLYAMNIVNGKKNGDTRLVKTNIGNVKYWGTDDKGCCYYSTSESGNNIYTANLNAGTGRSRKTVQLIRYNEGKNHHPSFSPDGEEVAYVTTWNKNSVLCINNLKNGSNREFNLANYDISGARSFRWSKDGKSVMASGRDIHGKFGLFLFNIQAGNVNPVIPRDKWSTNFIHSGELSPDGETAFYVEFDTSDGWASKNKVARIIARNIKTGSEKEISRYNDYIKISLSPNGKQLAVSTPEAIEVIEIHEPKTQTIYNFDNILDIERPLAWSPDGKFIYFQRKLPEEQNWELNRVALQDGKVQNLGFVTNKKMDNIRMHPNGNQVLYSMEEKKQVEFWKMENVEATVRTLSSIN